MAERPDIEEHHAARRRPVRIPMRIAILANQYGALPETFVRREVQALQARGHACAVFAGYTDTASPQGPAATVPVEQWTDAAIAAFAPDVLFAQMGLRAHRRAVEVSRALSIPFALRVWQGFDAFADPSPEFYAGASADPRCLGVIVEDDFMRDYATAAMRCRGDRVAVVPNSINVERFTPRTTPREPGPLRVLAVARFVPKKGLVHLVRAVSLARAAGADIALRLVGYGPERARLVETAGPGVTISDPVPEDELPALHRSADVFAAPGVQMPNGDADGIPTTVLEAMACGLTVIVSDLLSARCYVEHGVSGYRVGPSEDELAHVLGRLASLSPVVELQRAELGAAARVFAVEHLDIRRNIERVEAVLHAR